jgi:FkbM family methyltransferase
LLRASGAEFLPVRVRKGVAARARWTLYPFSSYWRGTHEPAVQAAIQELGGGNISGWSCWDLGAHYGLYSVGLALRTGPSGEVAAFEPNPLTFSRLERHRRMNRLNHLKLFKAAASDSEGQQSLFTYGSLRSTTTHLRFDGEAGVGGQPIEVDTLTLDGLVASGRIREPDFVKIDVEGHGHRALAGAMRSIANKRPILLVALHSEPETLGIMGLLQPLGYSCVRLLSGDDFLFIPDRAKDQI